MKSTSRRNFLKLVGAAAACAAVDPQLEAKRLRTPIGLQLYSVREQLPKDFAGTLAQVHGAGYRVVEAAGYFNRTAADFRQAMETAGLRCVSTHHDLKTLKRSSTSGSTTATLLALNTSSARRQAACIGILRQKECRRLMTGTGLQMNSTASAPR